MKWDQVGQVGHGISTALPGYQGCHVVRTGTNDYSDRNLRVQTVASSLHR